MTVDEVWGVFGNAGSGTLSGQILDLDRPLALTAPENRFVAHKQPFPEARQRIGLNPSLLAWLISPEHRLFHQLWHATRDQWHKLSEEKRDALRGIGWQPGPRGKERDARGKLKDRNGSGIDFFFMHRHMLGTARAMQDLPSWSAFPEPQPALERDRLGFLRYFDNHDGFALPPTWLAPDDGDYTQWVSDIKAAETYHSNFQVWESQYRDPRYLAKLTLGQLGSEMELGLHDWLHMRWASVPATPPTAPPCPSPATRQTLPRVGMHPKTTFLAIRFPPTSTRCSGTSMAGSTTASKTGSAPMSASIPARSAAWRSTAWHGSRRGGGLKSATRGWARIPMAAAPRQACRGGVRWRWTQRS